MVDKHACSFEVTSIFPTFPCNQQRSDGQPVLHNYLTAMPIYGKEASPGNPSMTIFGWLRSFLLVMKAPGTGIEPTATVGMAWHLTFT